MAIIFELRFSLAGQLKSEGIAVLSRDSANVGQLLLNKVFEASYGSFLHTKL